VEVGQLRQGIAQVVFATATEESRPVLTGVDAQFEGKQLTLAAADGFRLSVFKLNLSKPVSEKIEVIIPARAITELNRLAADQEEPVDITVNPKKSQSFIPLERL